MGIIILFIVLAVIAVILLAPIKLRIKYEAEPQISLRFLFLKYRIFPKKQPKKKMSRKDFLSKLFEKRKRRASVAKKASAAHKKKKSSASDILEFIKSASDFLKKMLGSFLKRAKIKVSEINIVVATEEASKTAIMYGVISQAVAYLLQLLDNFTKLKKAYKGSICVVPDFTREDSSIKLDICLQYRLLNASGLLLSALLYVMKNPGLFKYKNKKSTKNG